MNSPAQTSGAPIKYAAVSATADGANSLVAAVTGKKIRVITYALTVTAAGKVELRDITGATSRGSFSLAANGGVAYAGTPISPAFETASGSGLEVGRASC